MNKFVFFLSFFLVGVIGCRALGENKNQVCIKNFCVDVELAMTNEQRMKGLQLRRELSDYSGMLFVFERSDNYSFWMKDTYIPLDMIWLNEGKKIVEIAAHVQPCSSGLCPSITPRDKALYVLEVNAGLAEKNNIHVGDTADFKMQNVDSL